jgi:hypothetical protein
MRACVRLYKAKCLGIEYLAGRKSFQDGKYRQTLQHLHSRQEYPQLAGLG